VVEVTFEWNLYDLPVVMNANIDAIRGCVKPEDWKNQTGTSG
jgi:hypothetical protein